MTDTARSWPLVPVALVLLLTATACGDAPEYTASESAAQTSGGETRADSATFTVDGDTYEFDRPRCAFEPEETGREDTEFVLSAIEDGMQLDATIDTRFGHVVSLDGKRVTVEATFTDQSTGATAPGTLEATCP